MSVFWKRRVAAKRHWCEWDCGSPIEPGVSYQQCFITPGDAEFGTGRWQSLSFHSGDPNACGGSDFDEREGT